MWALLDQDSINLQANSKRWNNLVKFCKVPASRCQSIARTFPSCTPGVRSPSLTELQHETNGRAMSSLTADLNLR
jgi:hypothetical protein